MEIRLIPKSEIGGIVPLLRILDESISPSVLTERIEAMVADHAYECVGLYDDERLVGISGLWTLTKYYVGRHVEPDNVVIDPAYRGHGLGEKLLAWIHDYARSKGCRAAELNCYSQNSGGNHFWHRLGYRIIGFHYQKLLD